MLLVAIAGWGVWLLCFLGRMLGSPSDGLGFGLDQVGDLVVEIVWERVACVCQ
jgi:hypothetical protein